MPNNVSVENNFIGGLKTEFTGLNFPENACTATSNCVFSIIGDVVRREGINFENNFATITSGISPSLGGEAISSHRWLNAGGDGETEVLVVQYGDNLGFFVSSNSTPTAPLSHTLIMPVISLTTYQVAGAPDPSTVEAQFADGNGYLFVFHPYCDPFYVIYQPNGPNVAITSAPIKVQIRDFAGVNPEPGAPAITLRPTTLTNEHNYNLQNQGWTNNNIWSSNSNTSNLTISGTALKLSTVPGSYTWTIATGLTIVNGTVVNLSWSCPINYTAVGDGTYNTLATGTATGTVTSYTSGTGSISLTVSGQTGFNLGSGSSGINSKGTETWSFQASNLLSTISTWNTAIGNYPSNSDIWFTFKDAGTLTGENGVPTFNPGVTIGQIQLSTTQAPQGHFVLNAFDQEKSTVSGIPSLTPISTLARPKTGTWFQGRVWYAGVDATQGPTGDAPFYTWTENVYFSQIVTNVTDFGLCYQNNDPTDDQLFELLPDDGGVIVVQGSGAIRKLFPIQNGLFIFADNGIWFVRGNTGLGFVANDYTVTKISSIKNISGTSFVDVLGYPFFWNEEGIYAVEPSKEQAPYGFGGFSVNPLTVGTIKSFYDSIPLDSKRYARGAYDPINYTIAWTYRSTQEANIANRYLFDSVLNLNIFNKAFYPYAIANNNNMVFVSGVVYMDYPQGQIEPTFKYLTTASFEGFLYFTFAEENDDVTWLDWFSFDELGVDYPSFFTTSYKVHGQAFRKWMPIYVEMYSNNSVPTQYAIQGIWDYAASGNTGRFSTTQNITNPMSYTLASGAHWPGDVSDYGFLTRRHKIRGHGKVLQMNVSSITGHPFHVIGWSIPEQINTGA